MSSVKTFFNELREDGKTVASSIFESLQAVEQDIEELKLANARLNRIKSLFFQFNQSNMRFFNQIENSDTVSIPADLKSSANLAINEKTEFKRPYSIGENIESPILKLSKNSI